MKSQAHLRIYRTRINIIAVAVVSVLALVLYVRLGAAPARIVLEAIGTVTITLVIAQYLIERWLWKTKLGNMMGFPPNYSGVWEGEVIRLRNTSDLKTVTTKIEVTVDQNLTQIEWNQIGFTQEGEKLTESHLILGEVIDYHRKWDGIVGIYAVERYDGTKDEGMQLLSVSGDGKEITGMYCGTNGNVGKMCLHRRPES